MKSLRRGELRGLTCPRHRVVYWQSRQKHFPTPSLELCSSTFYCHPLLKVNTNPAWNVEEFSICGEQGKWWLLRWKSIWGKERRNRWFYFVITCWPSLHKTFCASLPPCAFPQKIIKWFGCHPTGFVFVCSEVICFGNFPMYRLSPGIDCFVGDITVDLCYLHKPGVL